MRVVLTGASGQLGAYLIPSLHQLGHEVEGWSRSTSTGEGGTRFRPVDLTDEVATLNALDQFNPDVVIHAAAMSAADAVRRDPEAGLAVNFKGTLNLVGWCRTEDKRLLFTSTDLVFGGTRAPYVEDFFPDPIMEYGKTKARAETVVMTVPKGLVTRLSLLYGFTKCGRPNFFDKAVDALKSGQVQKFFDNEYRTPLHYQAAAQILAALVDHDLVGRLHVAGLERMSRYVMMQRVARELGLDESLVAANQFVPGEHPEPRPANVCLDTTKLEGLFPSKFRKSIEESLRQ